MSVRDAAQLQFERWARRNGYFMDKYTAMPRSQYYAPETRAAWAGWLAAVRASRRAGKQGGAK